MSEFAAASAVTPLGDGRYGADLHPDWSIGDKPHGGYTMATLTRAALTAAGRPHPLAVSAHFLRPPHFREVEIETEVVRSGRTVTTVRARLMQDGRECIEAVVAAGDLTDEDHEWTAGPPATMPPVEDCYGGMQQSGDPALAVGIRKVLDLRLDPERVGFTRGEPSGNPDLRGWIRLADGSDPDPLALIVATDALPPVVLELGHGGWCPTVELTFLLRALPAPGWLATRTWTSALSAQGWFDENADVWDSAGRLVAQSRQLALSGPALARRG